MAQEIERRLVGGIWRTVVVNDESGGSQPGAARWVGPWTIYEAALQLLAITNADGGTYTLTDGSDTTDPIAFDATPAEIVAALNAATAAGRWTTPGAGGGTALLQIGDGFVPVALTADATNLTGGGDPPAASLLTPGENIEVELFTPEVGDIVEDILIEVTAAFADSGAQLAVKDDDGEFLSTASAYPALNDMLDGRTNFSGNGDNSGANVAPTAYGIELASTSPYPIIPAVCLNAVAIGAYLDTGGTPPTGVAKIWVKTATPAAP